jgi:hypothetical protein
VVLEEAPRAKNWPFQVLETVVAFRQNEYCFRQATTNLITHLRRHPHLNLAEVAYTLKLGGRLLIIAEWLFVKPR